ncbi:MAG TPA: DUF992 domain-containing protein [Rhodospirillales bacterium]|nr:DUF992 domain-containing protein [Rhodospirillales bacterium]
MRKLLMILVLPVIMLAATPSASHAEGGLNLGSIVCVKGDHPFGATYLFYSEQEMDCTYYGVGGPQKYTAKEGILLGIDLQYRDSESMTFFVLGGSWDASKSLEGDYIGVQASATAGVGVTVQAGLIGIGTNITLIPFGLGGGIGIGVSGGLSHLNLELDCDC